MPGVSFDRAASFYDATRALPAGVTEQIRDKLVQELAIRPDWRMLEIGIGTGRIAMPFINAGYNYWGVDISSEMLHVLLHNFTALQPTLIQGDVMRLPFHDASFDALLTMHVLHLVNDWQATLREAVRVLRPGGWLVLLNDEHAKSQSLSAGDQVQQAWSAILDELHVPEQQRRARAVRGLNPYFIDFLHDQAACIQRITLVEYHKAPMSIRELVQQYQERIFSSLWFIPDDIYAQASQRLEDWMTSQCAEPDRPLERSGQIDALIARMKDESSLE